MPPVAQHPDYKNPATPRGRLETVHQHLLKREAGEWLKIAFLLLIGIPSLAVGPAIIALLFWLERRWGANYLKDAAHWSGVTGSSGGLITMSMPQWQAMAGMYGGDPDVVGAIYLEICLWGPRMVLSALDKIRRAVNRPRASAILADLRDREHGLTLDQLQHPDEDTGQFLVALAYLLTYDWIAASRDGKKVWIGSDSRRILAAAFG